MARLFFFAAIMWRVISLNAQTALPQKWSAGFSAGIVSFSKPEYNHGSGTNASGIAYGLNLSHHHQLANGNSFRFSLVARYERINAFTLDLSSAGVLHKEVITSQRAISVQAAVTHEIGINSTLYLPIRFGAGVPIYQKHSGYSHFAVTGSEETYSYYTNIADPNRRNLVVFGALGLGVKPAPRVYIETTLELGNSPDTRFGLYSGALVSAGWMLF
ncbi:MAG: hypothetical protein MUC87_16945 [Bacteroidia bacterium]|jgi:hypothetical protein|nr:hypothetical protein [Bacteroidia bacterium]